MTDEMFMRAAPLVNAGPRKFSPKPSFFAPTDRQKFCLLDGLERGVSRAGFTSKPLFAGRIETGEPWDDNSISTRYLISSVERLKKEQ